MSKFLTTKDVSDIFNVKTQTVKRWIHKKMIEAVRIGRIYRISPEAVADMLKKLQAESQNK